MNEQKSIAVPMALKELINSNNILLQNYQRELTSKVLSANAEMMKMLGLNPDDGWRLDIQLMMYVKDEQINTNDTSIS